MCLPQFLRLAFHSSSSSSPPRAHAPAAAHRQKLLFEGSGTTHTERKGKEKCAVVVPPFHPPHSKNNKAPLPPKTSSQHVMMPNKHTSFSYAQRSGRRVFMVYTCAHDCKTLSLTFLCTFFFVLSLLCFCFFLKTQRCWSNGGGCLSLSLCLSFS